MKFRLAFSLDNDAFQQVDGSGIEPWAIARVLEKVGDKVVVGETAGMIHDANGNEVGGWAIVPEPEAL